MFSDFQKNLSTEFMEYKAWGFKYSVYNTSSYQVDLCCIKKGGYSSIHHHEYRTNIFLVLKGILNINLYPRIKADLQDCMTYTIGDGQKTRKFKIKPKIIHQFNAVTEVQLLEIYYTVCSDKDIVRQDQGGVNYEE